MRESKTFSGCVNVSQINARIADYMSTGGAVNQVKGKLDGITETRPQQEALVNLMQSKRLVRSASSFKDELACMSWPRFDMRLARRARRR